MDAATSKVVLTSFAVLVGLYFLFKPQKPRNFKNEDSILAELDVYICYGEQEKARQLLKEAVAANPKSWIYKDRLAHMK